MCVLICLFKEVRSYPLELKLCGLLWSADLIGGVRGRAGFLWEGPTPPLTLRHTCPNEKAHAEHREVGLGVSSSSLLCGCCAIHRSLSMLMSGGKNDIS